MCHVTPPPSTYGRTALLCGPAYNCCEVSYTEQSITRTNPFCLYVLYAKQRVLPSIAGRNYYGNQFHGEVLTTQNQESSMSTLNAVRRRPVAVRSVQREHTDATLRCCVPRSAARQQSRARAGL